MENMSLEFLIFLLALWSGLIVLLLFWRIYKIRHLRKEELYRGIVSNEQFFSDFNFVSRCFRKTYSGLAVMICFVSGKLSPHVRKIGKKPKNYFCKISDSIYGKRKIEKNGCSGYWHELNESVNGSTKDDAEKPG